MPERLQNLMATGDTNKDGFLDKAELTKIAEERGGGRRRHVVASEAEVVEADPAAPVVPRQW